MPSVEMIAMQLVLSLFSSPPAESQKAASSRVGILVHLSSKRNHLDEVNLLYINSYVKVSDVVEPRECFCQTDDVGNIWCKVVWTSFLVRQRLQTY